MELRDNPPAWWGIIALAIVLGAGFYSKNMERSDDTTPSVASNASVDAGQTSQ
jgi:hypothetical protein